MAKKRNSYQREIDIHLGINLHPAQQEVFNHPARFRVLDCGRKWGKSSTGKAEIVRGAGIPGYRTAYMCPTNKMLMDMWRAVKNILAPIEKEKSEQEHRFEVLNDAVIEFWSLDNPDGPRPFEYDLVIIDEAAMVDLINIWPEVIRPTLMKRHGKAIFMSTPRGLDGFWQFYELGQDPREAEWMSWKKPTWENPHISRDEIENMRREMPSRKFSEEIEAEFLSDSGAVFRKLKEALEKGDHRNHDRAIEGHMYVVGVDLAKTNDWSVFAVLDVSFDQPTLVCLEVSPHVDYSVQLTRLVHLAMKFRPMSIMVEQNTNLAFMEQLKATDLPIVPFTTGPTTKPLIIEALAGAFDNERIAILNDPDLLGELQAFSMERLQSGYMKYSASGAAHDDRVMAFAIAYHAATYNRPTWGPELIDTPSVSVTQGMLPPGIFTQEATIAPDVPDTILWPTAEYIFR